MPTFNFCTPAQLRQRLRDRLKLASGWEAVRLGRYIDGLGLSDNQLKTLFGVNDAQLVVLKAKLAAATARYNEVQAEQGA